MVRLKQYVFIVVIAGIPYFNPTMVRLKLLYKHNLHLILIYFNPTMVRLKLSINAIMTAVPIRFQSHNGSIKTNIILKVIV